VEQESPRPTPMDDVDRERYLDNSFDLVARIRTAREQYQRELEAFGDVSEYEIRKIYGQRTDINYNNVKDDTPATTPQKNLESAVEEPSTLDASGSDRRQGVLDFKTGESEPPQKEE
jgi:hypothetical protein